VLDPFFHLASRPLEQQGAVETAASLIAVLATVLAFVRLRRRSGLTELALAAAFAVIALSNVVLASIAVFTPLSANNVVVWSAIISRALGSLLFGVAAFVPDRPLRRPRDAPAAVAACATAGVALTFLLTWAWSGHLPAAVTRASPTRPVLHPAPMLLGLEMTTAVLGALAAAGYLRRFRRFGDELAGWLAIAAVFAAAASACYFLYPSLALRAVAAGDAFRLCFNATLLLGSMREIRSYWMALSDARVASERQRIARDLHDGVAQELAYLIRHLDALRGDVEEETLGSLRRATDRARLESRLVISGLAVATEKTTSEALGDAVGDVAKRFGLDVELDLSPGLRLAAPQTDALVRIACEATINAARHSGVTLVTVTLHRAGTAVRMMVSDRGCGFDPAASTAGFGLTSMRERARLIGAALIVSSEPGCGSQVEVIL
jgi:signal transduction histidine kinase